MTNFQDKLFFIVATK